VSFNSQLHNTPVGTLHLISSNNKLVLLKFFDSENPMHEFFFSKKLINRADKIITKTIQQLSEYFSGERKIFDVPIDFIYGTDFQKKVWNELKNVEYGKTESYLGISKNINNPKAYRATGNANNKNPISIIVPCHRIISNSGDIGGYGSGIANKEFLLKLEEKYF